MHSAFTHRENMMKKKSVALFLIPLFVLTACGGENEEKYAQAAPQDSNVNVNNEGFYTTEDLAKLNESYEKAQANGYKGSLDDWIALVQLSQSNPQQAQQVAQESGFSGGEMLLGALAGAAVGAIAGNALSSRSNMANNTYSAQRMNNNTNYAYSQPATNSKDCDSRYMDSKNKANCDSQSRSSSGYVNSGNNNTAAYAAAANTNRAGTNLNNTSTNVRPATTTAPAVRSAPAPAPKVTSVSRGGFGSSYGGGFSSGG
jgi:hypothetical protein